MSTDSTPQGSGNLAAKIGGAIFGLIIAPILAGLGINLAQKKLDVPVPPPAPAVSTPAPAVPPPEKDAKVSAPKVENTAKADSTAKAAGKAVATIAKPAIAPPPPAKPAPTKVITLFNGKDLTGFDTFLAAPRGANEKQKQPLGLNNDPHHVFSVVRRTQLKTQQRFAVIRVSGQIDGALETENDYDNYHLSLEYQWGEKNWRDNTEAPRHSAVTFHFSGAGAPHRVPFRPGYQCRISDLEGAGDLSVLAGGIQNLSLMVEAKVSEAGPKGRRVRYDYTPGAPPVVVHAGGVIHHLGAPKVPPTRAGAPPSQPLRWHKLDLFCQGDRVKILWEGKKVLEATKLSQTRGRIQLCSEGAEIFFRNIELELLAKESR